MPNTPGSYVDGIWYCRCGNQAKWLTSKQEISKGRSFLRCSNSGNKDCGFFIWKEDEPTQRDISWAEDSHTPSRPLRSQTPHTPPSSQNRSNPVSASQSSGRAKKHLGRDSFPTPNRKDDALLAGNSQLAKDVFNLLESNNVSLKSSTREQLRRLIDSEVCIYETKLENLQGSVSALGDQLDQLEVEDHQ